jgi:hypothetical protein
MTMTDDVKDEGTEAEAWLDTLDPATTEAKDATPLRRIAGALAGVSAAELELRRQVDAARRAGFSWAAIGTALGTSRQAAQQRYGSGTPARKKLVRKAPAERQAAAKRKVVRSARTGRTVRAAPAKRKAVAGRRNG